MAERVPPRLWPDTEPVRLLADRDAVDDLAGSGVEHVDLLIVASADPELLSICRDVAHVWATATGDRPGRHHGSRLRVEDAYGPGAMSSGREGTPPSIRDVE